MNKIVGYCRVSTKKQGIGLEAQRAEIERFCAQHGYELVGTFVETQTGKGSDAESIRPQLEAAMRLAKRHRCPVIVAKLDRLSRNVCYIAGLMERKVPFIVANLGPDVDPFMLHIYAALAEKERNFISQRTREGLAQVRKQGTWISKAGNECHGLGHPRIADLKGKGAVSLKADADAFAERVVPVITAIQARGVTSLRGIAAELERMRMSTPRGNTGWHASQVRNLLARAA